MASKYKPSSWVSFSKDIEAKHQLKLLEFYSDVVIIKNDQICISFQDYFDLFPKTPVWIKKLSILEYTEGQEYELNLSEISHLGESCHYILNTGSKIFYYDPIKEFISQYDINTNVVLESQPVSKLIVYSWLENYDETTVLSKLDKLILEILHRRGYIALHYLNDNNKSTIKRKNLRT